MYMWVTREFTTVMDIQWINFTYWSILCQLTSNLLVHYYGYVTYILSKSNNFRSISNIA